MSYDISPSPNFFPRPRARTRGIVLHSTRGGAPYGREYEGTLAWFANEASQVSAHLVIAHDGRAAVVVPDDLIAWHAGEYNTEWLGVELEQPNPGDPISDAQHAVLAQWCREMAAKYGFPLDSGTLVEHKDTDQGRRYGKSDIGPPFSVLRLLEEIYPATGVGMTEEQKQALRVIAGRIADWAAWNHGRAYVPGDAEPVDHVAARMAREFTDLANHARQLADG